MKIEEKQGKGRFELDVGSNGRICSNKTLKGCTPIIIHSPKKVYMLAFSLTSNIYFKMEQVALS